MKRKIVYELDKYDIEEALAMYFGKYFGVDEITITLSAVTNVMGYEIEAPIKAEVEYSI